MPPFWVQLADARRRRSAPRTWDSEVTVGSVVLPNPVMTASGTAGHAAELARYMDLASLGAVVVKSISADPWKGNPPPRIHAASGEVGMLNSVGLQGPGVEAWAADELPALAATGARVVASIWGFTVDDVRRAAQLLVKAGTTATKSIVAVECNLSCPNVEDRRTMFAHSVDGATAATAAACEGLDGRWPLWAKLSPNVTDVTEIAAAVQRAGAEAATLVNTVMGMAIDPETRTYRLGSGPNGGGLSGAAVHHVAVRAVHDTYRAVPGLPIVGVGGVSTGADAAELMLAGASAIQVGTATFARPDACARVLAELGSYGPPRTLTGAIHAQ